MSTESYADVFGMKWTAPTGSADQCLGDHAIFTGVPGLIGSWGSAWVAHAWFDAPSPAQPAEVQSSMIAAGDSLPPVEYWLLRTGADATDVIVTLADGTEIDRAPVTERVAMVRVDVLTTQTVGNLNMVVVAPDGTRSAPAPLAYPDRPGPAECGPGEPPQRPLPPAGTQPADPTAAAAHIRARHALLVDQTIPAAQKPDDLLDDDTGIADAMRSVSTGQYKDLAASAAYSIDELVFTGPDEAWFRYTLTTSASAWPDRFGTATFNGRVWQISRATVCQDIALAQVQCEPRTEPIEPPANPEWEAAWQEWVSRAMLYTGNDGCPPLSQC